MSLVLRLVLSIMLIDQVGDYLSSQKYNRVGTSVAFDHTTEAKSYTIRYTDPYTKEVKSRNV